MSCNLSIIFDLPLIYKTVNYIIWLVSWWCEPCLAPYMVLLNEFLFLVIQKWQLTSETCRDHNETEIINTDGSVTVMVR
jgi:hypothetical protein